MIYFYRILWLLFLLPIFIIESIIFIIAIPVCVIAFIVYFIKDGDFEKVPEWYLPGKLSLQINDWYIELLNRLWI